MLDLISHKQNLIGSYISRVMAFKVLITKLGLDGHDRGAKVIAKALADAGFEVVYLGIHQTPEAVVDAALQEDVNAIGVSILSGSHIELAEDLLKIMRMKNFNVPVIFGGIIPSSDVELMKKIGIYDVCGPGTSLKAIVELFNKAVRGGES